MSGINTGRVVAGGLVAGVVLNIIDFVANLVLASDFAANTARLNLDPATAQAPAAMVTWIVIDLLLGLVLVFTYAAMRPRFGAGSKTAIVAGGTIWFAISLIVFGFSTIGMIDMPLYWKATFISLLNVLIAANLGASIYKEA